MTSSLTLSLGRVTSLLSRKASANQLMANYAKHGDTASFTALYKQYTDRVYYFILVMSSPDIAAEVSQKTWLKVIEKRHRYRDENNFNAWLFTLARRTLIDELRRSQHIVYDLETLEVAEQIQTKDAQQQAQETLFHLGIQQLPFKQKEALSLQLDGFSLSDIAQICHTNKETIKTRLRYAKANLKQLMKVDDET